MRTITRQQAIDLLRPRLAEQADDKHGICDVAARTGMLCNDFAQWSYADLKRRFWWLADRRPGISRAELERLANIWQVARQQVFGTELSCDTQTLEHDTCHGWDQWDNITLAKYVREFCNEDVVILPDTMP